MSAPEDVRSLYRRTAAGDIGVLGVFCEKATVDTPINGRQLPHEFLAETRAWLDHHSARIDDVRTTATDDRVVHEAILWVDVDGETRELPIMLVADIADGCVRDLRVYHSTWPLCGSHSVRHALMRYDLAERPAEPVGAYHDALAAGDAAAADAAFEPDGAVREPSGSAYEHAGEDRTAWYRAILGDGPLPLKLGTITDDGETVVYEYLAEQWGSTRIPAQAGAAAYTRGVSGKLASARIYDDVDPPASVLG